MIIKKFPQVKFELHLYMLGKHIAGNFSIKADDDMNVVLDSMWDYSEDDVFLESNARPSIRSSKMASHANPYESVIIVCKENGLNIKKILEPIDLSAFGMYRSEQGEPLDPDETMKCYNDKKDDIEEWRYEAHLRNVKRAIKIAQRRAAHAVVTRARRYDRIDQLTKSALSSAPCGPSEDLDFQDIIASILEKRQTKE